MACCSADLSPLFQPLRLGPVTLRNRFVLPPMQTGLAGNCALPERMIAWLRARAEGGVGLVFCEAGVTDRSAGAGHARAAEAVKGAGAAFMLQLRHPGDPHIAQDGRSAGVLTRGELDGLKEAWIRAAEAARRLGADGVALDAADDGQLGRFLRGMSGTGIEGYGGRVLADRARFPLELATAIRAATGPDFLVSLRFSRFGEADEGARLFPIAEELAEFGLRARLAGIDFLDVSSPRLASPEWPERDPSLGLAGWTKRLSGLPVIATDSAGPGTDMYADPRDGRDPALTIAMDIEERVRRFRNGEFDLVGIGRLQIANPDFVARLAAGRLDTLRLYNKQIDLGHLFERIEPGMMENL